jgi:serine/threonine protein kinase/tetratricopeptide (TPR) repeat protein
MSKSLPADTTISHYRIVSHVGSGGMGEVYLAQDTTLDRQVALKLLPADVAHDPERKRRFLREARAASALSHPNICVIHEVGETAHGQVFIVMEYVEGETLQHKIGHRPVDTAELVKVALQAADAIEAAHAKGITHRDLKPANLMVTPRGQVKVLDFGVAKVTAPAAQRAGSDLATASTTDPAVVMGTVQYMSPEQALGRDVDRRSDLFSLGVVLYEMATGRLPFPGATASETIDRITHAQPDAMARFNYELPSGLERIVRKCLEKDREWRYQSASDLRIDLQNLQRGSDAGRVPARASVSRAGQRRRLMVGAALVAVLVAASAGLYVMSSRAQGETISPVAVLPFANANADPNVEYLADGIPESIINSLSQLPALKVKSRNSVFTFKGREVSAQEVGEKLNVRAVVTGRIVQRADNLVINIELVDARDNSQIWGQQYNRRLADVFALQEEMAREISDKLRVKLTRAERQQLAKRPTENLKAFQYYTQGRVYTQRRTREDMLITIRYCQQALEEDRTYALAYACLSDAYLNLGLRSYIAPSEGRKKPEETARNAVQLDDNLAEAHVALGASYATTPPWDFEQSLSHLRRAIALKPSLALAHQYLGFTLARQGHVDDSLTECLKARELDLYSPIITKAVSSVYYLKRDFATAMTWLRKASDLGPQFTTPWDVGIYV